MEAAVDFVTDIARDQLGPTFYKEWIPFIGTLFLFIFGCNWAGAIVPWKLIELPGGELAAPTKDINTTVALALLTSLAYFYAVFETPTRRDVNQKPWRQLQTWVRNHKTFFNQTKSNQCNGKVRHDGVSLSLVNAHTF